MQPKTLRQLTACLTLAVVLLAGCLSTPIATPADVPPSPTLPLLPTPTRHQSIVITPTVKGDLSGYAFPDEFDPKARYLFYLHGKIIEDQGLVAVSPEFGAYEYTAILERLSASGLRVISEQRLKGTQPEVYADHVVEQIRKLLDAGVPAGQISVVGASKGAGIAIFVSNKLSDPEIRYVLMGICSPDEVAGLIARQVNLNGRVLSIYDEKDNLAGSCGDLFAYSEDKGIARYSEVVLKVGTGHAVLYSPLDDWVLPALQWAEQP